MDDKEYLKWIMPSIKNRTVSTNDVNGNFNFRIEKAKEQNLLPIVKSEVIIKYVNEFLLSLGMKTSSDPVIKPKKRETRKIEYSKINKKIKMILFG